MLNCSKCRKTFTTKQSLTYHINNLVCDKRKITCNKCGREFSRKSKLQYHEENGVCEKKITIKLKADCVISNDDLDRKRLYEENLKLKGQLEALKETPHNINNIDKQQINNIYLEVPPAFLTLDTFPILMKMLPDLLPTALSKHPTEFVSYLIKETNCNPKRPLFNSAQITNKKDPYAQISDGIKFIYASKKQVISGLIENKKSLLQEYVDQNGDKYGQRILKRYQDYLDRLDEDIGTIKDLEIEISCMLLNMSGVIGSEDWSKELLDNL